MFLGRRKDSRQSETIKTENKLSDVASAWVKDMKEDIPSTTNINVKVSKDAKSKRAGVDSDKLTKEQMANQGINVEKKDKIELQKKIVKTSKSKLEQFEDLNTGKAKDDDESFGKGKYTGKRKNREEIKNITAARNEVLMRKK